MAHTLTLTQGSTTAQLAESATNYLLISYFPKSPAQPPQQTGNADLDLITPIIDDVTITFRGSSNDNLIEKLAVVERILFNAARYQKDRYSGVVTTLTWKPSGATNSATVEVLGGYVDLPKDMLTAKGTPSNRLQSAVVHIMRRPVWEGAERGLYAFPFATTNGVLNVSQLYDHDISTTVNQNSSSGQKVLNVASTSGWAPGDLVLTSSSDDSRDEIGTIDTIQAGVSFTLLLNLTYTHTAVQADVVTRIFALYGDLPARARTRITLSGGNSANCQRVMAALRRDGTPANFQHTLPVASLPTGWAITAGTDTVISADANFVSGSKARYTPNGARTGEQLLARWVYTGANVVDQLGVFMPIVRYRDNASVPNFKLRMRAGYKISSAYQYGAYSLQFPSLTLFADSSGTTEIGSMDVGRLTVPRDWDIQTPAALVYELYVTAVAVTGTLDIDDTGLYPLGESGEGRGCVVAEFPIGIASQRAYLDARNRYQRAYLTDGSDVKQCGFSDYPDGGELWLWPQQAGQRLFFYAARNIDNGAKHNAATGLTAVVTYVPQYVHMRGTS